VGGCSFVDADIDRLRDAVGLRLGVVAEDDGAFAEAA
jgi:hypothetical protein